MSSSLLDIFATITDPRRAQGKMYGLAPILMVSVLAVLSGATSYRKVHGFIDSHLSRLNKAFGLGWRKAPASIYRPIHMIGLELGISVASAALRGEPTGCPRGFAADVIATAKKDLVPGELLDGEGGACVWGKLMPAGASIAGDYLPIGLAHNVEITRPVAAGSCLTMADVDLDPGDQLLALRRTMTGAEP